MSVWARFPTPRSRLPPCTRSIYTSPRPTLSTLRRSPEERSAPSCQPPRVGYLRGFSSHIKMGRSAAITAGMMLVAGARAQLTQQTGASRHLLTPSSAQCLLRLRHKGERRDRGAGGRAGGAPQCTLTCGDGERRERGAPAGCAECKSADTLRALAWPQTATPASTWTARRATTATRRPRATSATRAPAAAGWKLTPPSPPSRSACSGSKAIHSSTRRPARSATSSSRCTWPSTSRNNKSPSSRDSLATARCARVSLLARHSPVFLVAFLVVDAPLAIPHTAGTLFRSSP